MDLSIIKVQIVFILRQLVLPFDIYLLNRILYRSNNMISRSITRDHAISRSRYLVIAKKPCNHLRIICTTSLNLDSFRSERLLFGLNYLILTRLSNSN